MIPMVLRVEQLVKQISDSNNLIGHGQSLFIGPSH